MSLIDFGIGAGSISPLSQTVINSLSQFPVQDANTITFTKDREWYIGSPLVSTKRFIVETGVVIRGPNLFTNILTYTGTGPMFTSSGANWGMNQIAYSCPNGTVFDVAGPFLFLVSDTQCVNCLNMGTFDGGPGALSAAIWESSAFLNVSGQGMQLSGTLRRWGMAPFTVISSSPAHVALDLGSSAITNLTLNSFLASGVPGSVALKGLPGSANIPAGSVASIRDSALGNTGGMSALSGIDQEDVGYSFSNTFGVDTTKIIGFGFISTPAATDVLDGTDVPIAGTFTQGGESSQSSVSVGGEITMLNRITNRGTVSVNYDADKTTGAAANYLLKIQKDPLGVGAWADVEGAASTVTLAGGGSSQGQISGPTRFIATDKYRVTVRGVATATDVTFVTAGFEVTE